MSALTNTIRTLFVDREKPVRIRCREHDLWFLVTPNDHLRYSHGGCPECKRAELDAVRH